MLIAAACVVVLGLGVWIGTGMGGNNGNKNVLGYFNTEGTSSVFGSQYTRNRISAVIFLDTLADAPKDAWDVSEVGDGSVLAWIEPDGLLFYRLYIGAKGGVSAGKSCRKMFAGYSNLTEIDFGNNFNTEAVQDMSYMFSGCSSLHILDLSDLDMSNVKATLNMFENCPAGDDWQHLLH